MSSIVISLFQFHKGAIKTRTQTIDLPILRFQFHKGAIKTSRKRLKSMLSANFNSIKVRLKRCSDDE